MPKAKTRKVVTKRFKISGKGKLIKKSSRISHRKRIDDSSTKSRKKKRSVVSKGFTKRVKKMLA